MSLWLHWWNAIWRLRPAFSRLQTFLWFATAVAGFTVRTDMLGVTSIVRALNLNARYYNALVDHFHSAAVKLDQLTALWTQVVLRLFPQPLRINGRLVLVGDGIKIPKCGRKMPAVKRLHQQSESNTKPEYIMGHSLQAVSILMHAAASLFAVPLAIRIHEGWCGPTATGEPSSTRCSLYSASSPSPNPATSSPTPTMPPTRSSPACSGRTTIWSPG
jgi:hypothetical protein